MFPGKNFSKEQSLLLFWRKLPDSCALCNGENFIVSKRVAFRLLALALPDPVKREIKIVYPERNIMGCTLVVIVFSVNAGKVINTRREVMEAVLLMLFKSLISCAMFKGGIPWNIPHVTCIFFIYTQFLSYFCTYLKKIHIHVSLWVTSCYGNNYSYIS